MRHLVFPVLLITLSGCGNPFKFDPATTVILKVTGVDDDAGFVTDEHVFDTEQERINEKAVELVLENSAWQKNQMSQQAETLMIKLSPVNDVQGFADRITFGKVTAVEGNIIHLRVGNIPEDHNE